MVIGAGSRHEVHITAGPSLNAGARDTTAPSKSEQRDAARIMTVVHAPVRHDDDPAGGGVGKGAVGPGGDPCTVEINYKSEENQQLLIFLSIV